MKIDRNSYWSVLLILAICIAGISLVVTFVHVKAVAVILVLVLMWFAIFNTCFFRVPKRKPVGNSKIVTSAADGEVAIAGEKVYVEEYLGRECLQVSVYMNFFDMHANFWPVSGKVTYYKYHPGKHFLVIKPKISNENEHTTTCIRTKEGQEVMFRQIAGGFARRIVNYAGKGVSECVAGEQCGIIKFGSRMDIFLPLDADIKIRKGQVVRSCETVIAELR